MKRLMKQAAVTDPDAARMLEVIDEFDRLTAAQAPLSELAARAGAIAGRSVYIEDTWNARQVAWRLPSQKDDAAADPSTESVLAAIVGSQMSRRRSAVLDVDNRHVLAASLDISSGRIGAVWLVGNDKWGMRDHLVAERLATAVVANALATHAARGGVSPAGEALERLLLTAGEPPSELISNLPDLGGDEAVVVAVEEQPRSATSPLVLAEFVARKVRASGYRAAATALGGTAALAVESSREVLEVLERLSQAPSRTGSLLLFGVGEPAARADLARSWQQAREALVLSSLAPGGARVSRFADLGLLHLLGQLPISAVESFGDYHKMSALAAGGTNAADLDLLDVYCSEPSLRTTAKAVFLHWTTVRYRLAKIEAALGLDLSDATHRFRALIALKLVRMYDLRASQQDLLANAHFPFQPPEPGGAPGTNRNERRGGGHRPDRTPGELAAVAGTERKRSRSRSGAGNEAGDGRLSP